MKVHVQKNPKHPKGLAVMFPYSRQDVETIRQVLGFTWDKTIKAWVSEGPEVLLDMERFKIGIEWISNEAQRIAEEFRDEIQSGMTVRALPIDEHQYAYQETGSKWLSIMPNVILGDDMGTGKSKQSLDATTLAEWLQVIQAKKILVLCPNTLKDNWQSEVEKWQYKYSYGILPDDKFANPKSRRWKPNRDEFWHNMPELVISNYEKTILADWPFEIDWDIVICDEGTRFKNSTTATWKAVRKISRKSKFGLWVLTGTPLEIRLEELYNILHLLRPALLGGFYRFRDQHCVLDWSGSIIGTKNIELLRDRIGPFILRRTKEEVLSQLPEKIYQNQFVRLSPDEQDAYASFTKQFHNWLDEHDISGPGAAITQMLRMRQFCCTPAIWTEDLGKGSKFLALKEIIEEWPGKIVIFCFFEQVIELLHSWLGCHPDAIISGKVASSLRIPRVNAFNEGKLGKVLVSTDAGAYGLNITGADLIVHYDQLFNPQKMKQREDRLHRIGQRNNVTVLNMLCINTIDLGMYQLNKEREELFQDVVEGAEEAILRKLDAPRLRRLIQGQLNNDELYE